MESKVATDEAPKTELELLHESIAAKREAVAAAKAAEIVAVSVSTDELELLALRTEDARLDSELANATNAAHPDTIAAGNADNLAAAQAQLAAALGKTVDEVVTESQAVTPAPVVSSPPAPVYPPPPAPVNPAAIVAGTEGN